MEPQNINQQEASYRQEITAIKPLWVKIILYLNILAISYLSFLLAKYIFEIPFLLKSFSFVFGPKYIVILSILLSTAVIFLVLATIEIIRGLKNKINYTKWNTKVRLFLPLLALLIVIFHSTLFSFLSYIIPPSKYATCSERGCPPWGGYFIFYERKCFGIEMNTYGSDAQSPFTSCIGLPYGEWLEVK